MKIEKNKTGELSRRCFLLLAGGTISLIALKCGLPDRKFDPASDVEFPESSCKGKNKNSGKILVAYASRCGSTAGVAKAIGDVLCDRGWDTDIRLAKNIIDLSQYQAVVVGSAIRRGSWLPEAVNFVNVHKEKLSQIPVAYFLVCMTMRNPTEENIRKVHDYLDPVLKIKQIQPVDLGFFAGALDYSCLSGITRWVVKSKGDPEGDFRDWKAIRAWAAGIPLKNES